MADQLTAKQLTEFKEAFILLDKDDDGAITKRELISVLVELGETPKEETLREMMNEVNFNGNETIDFHEFLAFMSNKMRYTPEEEFEEMFRLLDIDGDGHITGGEIRLVMGTLGEAFTDEEIGDMMREADVDGDGYVNYEEFLKMMTTM